jgi:hypothetical protein
VAGHTELADEEDIQRGVQGMGELERDRHTAAGKPQHDHVLTSRVLAQTLCQEPAGLGPVAERRNRH